MTDASMQVCVDGTEHYCRLDVDVKEAIRCSLAQRCGLSARCLALTA